MPCVFGRKPYIFDRKAGVWSKCCRFLATEGVLNLFGAALFDSPTPTPTPTDKQTNSASDFSAVSKLKRLMSNTFSTKHHRRAFLSIPAVAARWAGPAGVRAWRCQAFVWGARFYSFWFFWMTVCGIQTVEGSERCLNATWKQWMWNWNKPSTKHI